MNRRNFIKGLSAAAASFHALGGQASTVAGSKSFPTVHLVHEERCDTDKEEFEKLGVRVDQVYTISGDVTDVWIKHLDGLWREKSELTAGITRDAEFFVLKTLARDQGYKVVYEQTVGSTVSWLLAPA